MFQKSKNKFSKQGSRQKLLMVYLFSKHLNLIIFSLVSCFWVIFILRIRVQVRVQHFHFCEFKFEY